jgi:hypothetical protein
MNQSTHGTVELNTLGALTGGTWTNSTTYAIPYSSLAYNTLYTVNITDFEDIAGNPMLADYANSFTTLSADKTALTAKIAEANGILTAATAGTGNGQYPQLAYNTFSAAIATAQTVEATPTATQTQVDDAIAALQTAINTFKAAQITIPPNPARIKGPASMTLTVGYEATQTEPYTVSGKAPVTVTKTGETRITWNRSTRRLEIPAGLPLGEYRVTLRAANTDGSQTLEFVLTVEEKVYFIGYPQSFEGGTVEVSTTNANPYLSVEGDEVTITVTPDDGYELESLTVYDYDNGAVTVPLTCTDGVCTFTMPAHSVRIVAVFKPAGDVAVEDLNALNSFTREGTLYISGLPEGAPYRVYNIIGTLICQGIAPASAETLYATSLPGRGVYVVVSGESVIKVAN